MIFLGDVKMINGRINKIEETERRSKVVTIFLSSPSCPDLQDFDTIEEYEVSFKEYLEDCDTFDRLHTGVVHLLQESI